MTTLTSFNTLFGMQQPDSPQRFATPQKNKARYLEARSKRTPRGKSPKEQPASVARPASGPSSPTKTPTHERWANGLVSPPPSALPMPCFDDDDFEPISDRPASAQRRLVFA